MKSLKNAVKARIPTKKYNKSFSQEGEDMILLRVLGDKKNGFYIDVGAHHPVRFSNTNHFYKKGWSGINIDPLPGSMTLFDKKRPRDINLESAVGRAGRLTYYMYDEPALNTFDEKLVSSRKRQKIPYDVVQTKKITIKPLDVILKKYLPKNTKIDFLTIDVEGKDMEVLQTNDWLVFRPEYILVECHGYGCLELDKDKKIRFLAKKGYVPIAKTFSTVLLGSKKT